MAHDKKSDPDKIAPHEYHRVQFACVEFADGVDQGNQADRRQKIDNARTGLVNWHAASSLY